MEDGGPEGRSLSCSEGGWPGEGWVRVISNAEATKLSYRKGRAKSFCPLEVRIGSEVWEC